MWHYMTSDQSAVNPGLIKLISKPNYQKRDSKKPNDIFKY